MKIRKANKSELLDLLEVLKYNKITGKFYWRKDIFPNVVSGDEARAINRHGRRIIKYNGRRWYASRLAWYFVYGYYPKLLIDHINGGRDDNRISNLREVTSRENSQNQKSHRNGKMIGARKSHGKRWMSNIRIGNKDVYLGTFDTEQEASDRYWQEVARLSNQEATK